MASRYWVPSANTSWNALATESWSATSGGAGGASVPTANDDVFLDANSGSGEISVSNAWPQAPCRSLNCTGFTGTLRGRFGRAVLAAGVGGITLSAGMTVGVDFEAWVIQGGNVTTAGKTLPPLKFTGAGTVTLQDSLNSSGAVTFEGFTGTFNANDKNVTAASFRLGNAGGQTINLGGGTWNANGSGIVWNVQGAATLNAGSSTILINDGGSGAKTFRGGGKTYNKVRFAGSGTGIFVVDGSNVFAELSVENPPKTVSFTYATTQAVGDLVANGGAQPITLQSSTPGLRWAISPTDPEAYILVEKVVLKDGAAAGGGVFEAYDSTDGGNNAGWLFSEEPGAFVCNLIQ